MGSNGKYPVTGRDTPIGEIVIVLALSALIVFMATQWRASGAESWQAWLALALVPGVLLRWLEIVRRTEWPLLEIAAGVLMTAIAAWGYMRIGGALLGATSAILALLTLLLAWRGLVRRD